MPIYEYSCQQCGNVVDVLQKVDDPPPPQCENCSAPGTLTRVVSRTSFVLKGGGWYSDLYSSTKKEGAKEAAAKPSENKPKESAAANTSTSTSAASAPSTPSKPEK
ncbi:MAG: FmdB family zinc ribbon protein [Myxococcota bacterium]